jgi:2-oxo-4-hydroxy-4-carboxy--5-ureidoimidazoline (OHCU) decarboxylase
MADMRRRLGNQADAEIATALDQIGRIARVRFEKILGDR